MLACIKSPLRPNPHKRVTIKSRIVATLLQAWRGKGPWACALLPLAALYRSVFGLRRALFQLGIFQVKHVDAMVVVVGNIITGGGGKTPTVIAIAKHLSARGIAVGVVSRGYGRTDTAIREVQIDSSPAQVGDEPLLIHKNARCPVYVGTNRYESASAMLRQHPAIRVVLCDDGLQHYALQRNVEVCVFDDRGLGNGWVLPAGPLREPWPRNYVGRSGQAPSHSLVLHTGQRAVFPGFTARRHLAACAQTRDGTQVPLHTLMGQLAKPLFALAGVAQPEAFFDMLDALNLPLAGRMALPDHFDFVDFDHSLGRNYQLLCTEKDAAKLWPIAQDALAIPLVQTMGNDFWQALDSCIGLHGVTPLSSAHGSKTT